MRGTLTRAVLVVATLLVATPASADETSSARAHFSRGTKLYDLGRYVEAAKEYEAAYEAKDDPAILFNIAQAYRLGRVYPDAIRAYKSFLRRVPQSEQRPQIEAHLREMQDALDRQQQPPPATTPPVTTTPPPTTTPLAATTKPAATSERTPLYKKWWLWTIVGGVIVAGVVVGVTVGVLAGRDSFNPSLGKLGPAALEVRF